ncbi:hypothetical protein A2276_06050 [candidate division WOR-1 bacterium RIFOXYA12_FULL_43_27]|uniref:Uncharacterized protein n=1 Tax=candidate division WOR-1 bacterium RIFOXYC2_FULL_46_14 TaxID=1802587 RepID=A0A1F4U577_UNCSA|nr:MAG: hypothetical protein A2276_06050 [candidate division WOR-1 bacterium RIFOXYA12_FULL_43_27]OGC20220.1 MAG: hypothetical protein A2292_04050 [candidate division WOR-1 bacterium RIFOXYB2_FULL_46_45]OGC32041.1 MAG: hypothetical protein A2232_07395 [candidate division WOR-1 bacterium RIFOXYA2_FULL_46_56]OGC39443.1 MAG: hypothetical protein A2438_07760 [candidate division WOR-1 bacterium RIFOXYC2_FULL_46_14]
MQEVEQLKTLISKTIEQLKLDLTGLTIVTEAASGNFIVTPMIAALAGAKKVIALTKDSQYGTAADVQKSTQELARELGINNTISIYSDRKKEYFEQADVATNLGFVRPIDKTIVGWLKRTAVIPLMFETFEFRSTDLDLSACQAKGISVLGTNESTNGIDIMQYLGLVVLKLISEQGIDVSQCKVVIVGDDVFGPAIVNTLIRREIQIDLIAGPLSGTKAQQLLSAADILVFADIKKRTVILGQGGELTVQQLKQLNNNIKIVHLSGGVDQAELDKYSLPYTPDKLAPIGYMSITTGCLGPQPIIELHTAGLKVGEELARARLSGLGFKESMAEALKNSVAQDFSKEQKEKYAYNK